MKIPCILALIAALTSSVLSSASVTSVTYDEVNFETDGGFYPKPEVVIGTESWVVPVGEYIVSATLSGIWGSTSLLVDSTAHAQLFFDGMLVSDTMTLTPDPYWNVVPWSYTFSDFSSLVDGSGKLSFVMTSQTWVRLSETTLAITTAGEKQPTVPDADATSLLLGGSMLALAAFTRRFKRA